MCFAAVTDTTARLCLQFVLVCVRFAHATARCCMYTFQNLYIAKLKLPSAATLTTIKTPRPQGKRSYRIDRTAIDLLLLLPITIAACCCYSSCHKLIPIAQYWIEPIKDTHHTP